ncbi:sulfite oxidase heme-binding subunit YedZ [Marinobacter caseinilyticus]|uniref:sulfite oxidase heme-binding subunit YedZ n=1 Tax=Marinobacter caseinilyticus TaxID=2692195 RepID=UPI001F22FBBD|nr:protein-methionine-sulfoxide reductase heme-binding subunit MsrQ [Marinobacter caseinilyticus]
MLYSRLGPDPGEVVTKSLGMAAFQLLLATLCLTPLRKLTGWPGWLRVRRMLGLFSFCYAALHVLAFFQFIIGWQDLWSSFTRRPYIIFGLIAFVIMVPLAATSSKAMMRRLGKRWKVLHRGVYIVAVSAWVHFLWQARSDVGEMLAYGFLLLFLLVARVIWSSAFKRRFVSGVQ